MAALNAWGRCCRIGLEPSKDDSVKSLFRQSASAVYIVTCSSEGKQCGITVSSLVSVSLDPPLLLFCIDKSSKRLPFFQNVKSFAVHWVLDNDIQLALQFAESMEKPFAECNSGSDVSECPILPTSGSVAIADLVNTVDGGDHLVFFVQLRQVIVVNQPSAIYVSGKFQRLTEECL